MTLTSNLSVILQVNMAKLSQFLQVKTVNQNHLAEQWSPNEVYIQWKWEKSLHPSKRQ